MNRIAKVQPSSLVEELRAYRNSAAKPNMAKIYDTMETAADEIEFLKSRTANEEQS